MVQPVAREAEVATKHGRHKRFRDLPCRAELDQRIRSGESLAQLAQWLHEEQLLFPDVTRESLATMLGRYRQDLGPAGIMEIAPPKFVVEAMSRIEGSLDEMEQIQMLYQAQLERIDLGMRLERAVGMLNGKTNDAIAQAADLLIKHLSIKTSLMDDAPNGQATFASDVEGVRGRYGGKVAEIVLDPSARGKVLSLVERIAHLHMIEVGGDSTDA